MSLALKPLMQLAVNNFESIPKKPGVYIVFWVKDGKPRSINRILGIDERGVLYIGSTKASLRRRLRDMWRSVEVARCRIKLKKYPHTFGPSLLYTGLHELIADQELWVFFKEFGENAAKKQEMSAILEYTRKYGEPPPLNLQVGRQYYIILGLGLLGKSKLKADLDPDLRSALNT